MLELRCRGIAQRLTFFLCTARKEADRLVLAKNFVRVPQEEFLSLIVLEEELNLEINFFFFQLDVPQAMCPMAPKASDYRPVAHLTELFGEFYEFHRMMGFLHRTVFGSCLI